MAAEQADDEITERRRLQKSPCAAGQAFAPDARRQRFAFQLLAHV